MLNARLRPVARALALTLLVALVAAGRVGAVARDGGTEAGTVISNTAEATYEDASGTGFRTVSPTVTVTVRSVSALTVTPDETEPSATVSPNERVTRLFRVCNTGNVPDLYTITRAEVSAPAALVSLHFDRDASGTLNEADARHHARPDHESARRAGHVRRRARRRGHEREPARLAPDDQPHRALERDRRAERRDRRRRARSSTPSATARASLRPTTPRSRPSSSSKAAGA